ncbi:MAG: signal peptidase II [Bacteroidota bacterium]|nr:signal peptidase II [Bacteroidota bacterium]MDP4229363.1 signal peptidase II [Bacteroidota bacterium]
MSSGETRPSVGRLLLISTSIVILDQVTKLLVKGVPFLSLKGLPYGSSRPFIDDIFRITYVENPGIAFGIQIPGMKIFFSIFSIVASVGIFIYIKRNRFRLPKWELIALAMIMGGAIGNLIDRCFYGVLYGEESLFYGHVVDFLDFGYKKNWWPVFNVADSCVSIGVVLLTLMLMKKKPPVAEPAIATDTNVPITE